MLDHDPPTETDGPPGGLAIAKACIGLGKKCVLVTDEVNATVVEAAMKVHIDNQPPAVVSSLLSLEKFPPASRWGPEEEKRLQALAQEISVVVAIERTGPSMSGHYYTMRGREMDVVVAPLERILEMLPAEVESIGIGDGGNEVGMGKVHELVLASSTIPNAQKIACCVATTHLLVASVSNWGGYALAAGLAVVKADKEAENNKKENIGDSREEWIRRLLVTTEIENAVLEGMVAAGARDGVTGEKQAWVDGMPAAKSMEILREIRRIASGE